MNIKRVVILMNASAALSAAMIKEATVLVLKGPKTPDAPYPVLEQTKPNGAQWKRERKGRG